MAISIGMAVVSGFGGVGALVGVAAVEFSFGAFALSLGISAAGRLLMSASSDTSNAGAAIATPGRLQIIRSAEQPRRVIYGETMVSGTLAFAGTGGNAVADTPARGYLSVVAAQYSEWGSLSRIGLTSLMLEQPSPTLGGSFDFQSGSTFTINAAYDATVYTLTADPALVYNADSTGLQMTTGVSIEFTPPLVKDPTGGTGVTTLEAVAPVSAADQGGANDYLYLVIALAGHECEEIGTVWFNETPEYDASLTGFATVTRHLGGAGQTADAGLMAAFPADWTSAYPGDGVCYIVCQLKWDASVWQSGIPNITAVVKGKKIYDPRDAGTRWTNNWALVCRDYLSSSYGLACVSAEIDDTSFIAAANIADEVEALVPAGWTFTAATNDELTVTDDTRRIRSGDAVTVSTTGTLPAGLAAATTYYAMRRGASGDKVIKLCTTWAAAMAGTGPIDITSTGSGVHTITIAAQRRYTCDGSFDLDVLPQSNIEALVSAGAGMIVCQGGVWKLYAGAWRASTKTITDDMLAGPVKVQARTPRSSLYNSVKGVYSDPANQWQTSDFAPITNATYVSQDNGETIWQDILLPFTTDSIRAQRIAKILLEKSRQQISVSLTLNMTGLSIAAGDTVAVTNSLLGWSAKPFTVTSWTFDASGISLTLQEEASTCYDWDLGDETTVDAAPDTTLAPNWAILTPQDVLVYQGIVRGGDAWQSFLSVRWNPPLDTRILGYSVRARHQSADWITLAALARENRYDIVPVIPGDYDVAVQAIAGNGAASAWVQQSITVLAQIGLLDNIGLPPPKTATLGLHWTDDGNGGTRIDRARLSVVVGDVPFNAMPDAVLLCYAAFDDPNQVKILSGGTGTSLAIYNASAQVISRGQGLTRAGSTAARIVLADSWNPFPPGVPYPSRFWGALTHWDWHKAVSYDNVSVTFDPPFSSAPGTGVVLDYVELSWFDERPEDSRFGLVTALDGYGYPTGSYEIVRWQTVASVDASMTIEGISRAQEGTTAASANGKTMMYFPAPGAGSVSEVFPVGAWVDQGDGTWKADIAVALDIKPGQWVAPMSCALYKVQGTGIARSYLRPVTFAGAIS